MPPSPFRLARIEAVTKMVTEGFSTREIAELLHIAPTTVRDYRNDPERKKARKRQRKYPVTGISIPAGGTPVAAVKSRWKSGGPAGDPGLAGAAIRGRQMRAVTGYYARRA